MSGSSDQATGGPPPAGDARARRRVPRRALGHDVAQRLAGRVCRLLYPRYPGAALAVAAAMGSLVAGWDRPVTAATLAALLGEPLGRRHRALARSLSRNSFRGLLLRQLLRRQGLEPLTRTLRWEGLELLLGPHRAGQPVIVVFTHLGPPGGIAVALAAAGLPFVLLGARTAWLELPATGRVVVIEGSATAAALGLKTALGALRSGSVVLLAADGDHGQTASGPGALGGGPQVQRGIGMLHRLTGAVVIPVAILWADRNRQIRVRVHAPLPAASPDQPGTEVEAAMHAAVTSWLEGHIREHVDQLRPSQIEKHYGVCDAGRGASEAVDPED